MRIATYNVQNLRLRRGPGAPRLDGARDGDDPPTEADPARDLADRRLTAAVIAGADADVVCLQEVYDLPSLDHFHDAFLRPTGAAPWPHRVCLPGNDGHGRDVAIMSRVPLDDVASHAGLTPASLGLRPPPGVDPARPIFCRDVLRARVGPLTLFVVHFKAPWPDRAAARIARRLEAEALRRLIERRFGDAPDALWLILGDFNEPARPEGPDRAIAPLLPPFACDLMQRLPPDERWSYRLPGSGLRSCPDGMLVAPALARRWPAACPQLHRGAMPPDPAAGPTARCPKGSHPRGSDHALLALDLPGLWDPTMPQPCARPGTAAGTASVTTSGTASGTGPGGKR
ncbi:MAG: endonuclease/exonuclease/phosphatase family protein [Alkalilacustris sp.]